VTPYVPPTMTPAPQRRKRPGTAAIVIGAIAGLLVLVFCLGAVGSSIGADGSGDRANAVAGPGEAVGEPAGSAAAAATPPAAVMTAADVKIGVKRLSKECFGTAGCHVEVQVTLGWPEEFDAQEYDVTYVISYDGMGYDADFEPRREKAETVGTSHLADGKYEAEKHLLQTYNTNTKINVKVDQVEVRS
jgi:hypothetical protein